MKKPLFIILFITILMNSCSIETAALKGNYQDKPYEINSTKSFDAVWSNVIDLFAQKGLSIQIIDKSSGLITSTKQSLIFTIENDNGIPKDTSAWVVSTLINAGVMTYSPDRMEGEWNIRIKPSNNGSGTTINVNLTNVEGYYHNYLYTQFQAKSTGKFEALIANIIK